MSKSGERRVKQTLKPGERGEIYSHNDGDYASGVARQVEHRRMTSEEETAAVNVATLS